MKIRTPKKLDLTVVAIPFFTAAMAAEWWWQRTHPVEPGTRAGDYQLADTVASLSMGVGSLAAPYVAKKLLDPLTPGVGKHGKVLLTVGAIAAVVTTVGDVVRRRLREGELPEAQTVPRHIREVQDELAALRQADARPVPNRIEPSRSEVPNLKVPGQLATAAVFSTALTVATTWAANTAGSKLFKKSPLDLGNSKAAVAVAILGWDFIYYWNHRLSHESRWLWAMHVVHHSSERYNLSTALRQPVADSLTVHVPYGLLSLMGVRPSLIEQARSLNLIYQFWIHTEAIKSIGWLEKILNTPAHHRVHHGSNREYLDRNHGSILIIWDRLFGTFEPEGEQVVYGLTKNINTYNPIKIATHEFVDIGRDIAAADNWRDRISYLVRGPGWAYERRAIA
ncbi:MAG: sterol desaturase family protein [Marmoricola sp.]